MLHLPTLAMSLPAQLLVVACKDTICRNNELAIGTGVGGGRELVEWMHSCMGIEEEPGHGGGRRGESGSNVTCWIFLLFKIFLSTPWTYATHKQVLYKWKEPLVFGQPTRSTKYFYLLCAGCLIIHQHRIQCMPFGMSTSVLMIKDRIGALGCSPEQYVLAHCWHALFVNITTSPANAHWCSMHAKRLAVEKSRRRHSGVGRGQRTGWEESRTNKLSSARSIVPCWAMSSSMGLLCAS